ncbi:hypothetical protein H0H87_008587 [Tephrocybe sp. NHM501043]|nr:hypothetical protein H0H87_008587 [Tephrocybe sp. NHM501043]
MATTVRDIIVDDSDPRIEYSGAQTTWTTDTTGLNDVGTYGPIYNGTSHGTRSFQRTAIFAYGTNKQTNYPSNNTYSPGGSCIVDLVNYNTTPGFFDPQNNWLLCYAQNLKPGSHTLTLRVATYGEVFWLDYLRYTPSLEFKFSGEETAAIHVKSDDPAIRFGKKDDWKTFQAGFTAVEDALYTSIVGQNVSFSFFGTKLDWYGWLLLSPHNPASASYTIDSSISGRFDFGNTPAVNVTHPNAFFFSTPILPLGPHELVVMYNGGPGNQPSPLSLGYLILTGTSITSAAVTVPPSSSSSGLPPSSNTPTLQSGTSLSVGAIVGGVVGGLALIALLLFILWWWRRQKYSRHANPSEAGSQQHSAAVVEPFTLTQQRQQQLPLRGTSSKGLPPYSQYQHTPSASRSPLTSEFASGSSSGSGRKPGIHSRDTSAQAPEWEEYGPRPELQKIRKLPLLDGEVRA